MKPSEVHGQKCHELIGHPMPCRICATSEVYQTQHVAKKEKYVQELNKWLDVRAYPVFDEKGAMVQVVEHLRDISSENRFSQPKKKAGVPVWALPQLTASSKTTGAS